MIVLLRYTFLIHWYLLNYFFCSITLAFSLIRLWLYTIFSVSRPAPKGGQHPRPPFRQTVKTRKGEITKKTRPAGHYSTCIPPLSASGPASPPPGEPLAPRRCSAGSPKSPGCTSHPPVDPRHATSARPLGGLLDPRPQLGLLVLPPLTVLKQVVHRLLSATDILRVASPQWSSGLLSVLFKCTPVRACPDLSW